MKKFYLLAILVFMHSFYVNAQSADPTYTEVVDRIMTSVNKSQITTGILYDRVYPWAGLQAFNKLGNDTSSYRHFFQAYSEIYNAAYNKAGMISDARMDTIIKAVSYTNNVVPIGVLCYDINIIDTNALANNLFYKGSDSLMYDNPYRTMNPYLLRTTVVAAALNKKEIPFGGGSIRFQLVNGLFLTNKNISISSMYADFGSGNQSIYFGSPVTVRYTTGGVKTIRFTINLSNYQQIITYSTISIGNPSSSLGVMSIMSTQSDPPVQRDVIDTEYGFQGFDEAQKLYNAGKYSIYFHRNTPGGPIEQLIKKPIIIIDGFDPTDIRKEPDIYDKYLRYAGDTRNFGEEMRNKGYDVIILNFPEIPKGTIGVPPFGSYPEARQTGGDYIERNAFLLVTLIKTINKELQTNGSTNKLVVVGPSMGGLISRYALRWMEYNGINHNTRLWISFDSPHEGANIPIGDQYFLDFFARKTRNTGAQEARDNQINSYAARQMLLHHYTAETGFPAGAPGFRNTWQGTIDGLGYPNNLRRISLINGSINGATTGFACQPVLEMETFTKFKFFFQIYLGWARIAKSQINFAGSYGNLCDVFQGWAFLVLNGGRKSAAAPYSSKSYDIVPGGTYTAQQDIASEGGFTSFKAGSDIPFGTKTNFNLIKAEHSFIPTKSALGMTIINRDLGENLYNRNLVCTGETPFHSYYAPLSNESHVTLTQGSVDWLIKEIDGFPQPPTVNGTPLYPISLTSGREPICNGATTYQIANLPAGSIINWRVDPNIAFVSQNGNQVSLTKNGSGTATLFADVTIPGCASFSVMRTIVVGGGPAYWPNMDITGPNPVSCGQVVTYSTTYIEGAVYNWNYPSSWIYNYGQGTWSITLQIPYYSSSSTSGDIRLLVADACNNTYLSYYPVYSSCGEYYYYSMSPNPTGSNLTISAKGTTAKGEKVDKGITEVNVYDQLGNLKKRQQFGNVKTATLNVSGLPVGLYFVEIVDGTFKERQRLSIKR